MTRPLTLNLLDDVVEIGAVDLFHRLQRRGVTAAPVMIGRTAREHDQKYLTTASLRAAG
jgi:hypothetical protein